MKRIFAALCLVWLAISTAFAVDSPHITNESCIGTNGCHTSKDNGLGGYTTDLSDAVGVNILCLKCHNPKMMNKSFSPKDIANPFGTTDTGLAPSEQIQSSHNWAAPVNVPAAGAAISQNPEIMNLRVTQQGLISCASCHNQHSFTGGNLLRKEMDQLCLDCHRERNQRSAQSGTHPVNFTYTSATSKVKLKKGEYQSLPVNANPANPTSAMKLPGGKVLCSTCHGIHFTDSNARTFDNASSATFGRLSSSKGHLLRTDLRGGTADAVNICTNCHAVKLAHNNKGQNVQCADCHGGHVDAGDGSLPNVWLVRRYMNYSGGAQVSGYSRKVLNQYTGSRSNFAGPYGVCVACHAVPPPSAGYPGEHLSTDASVCRGCHPHNSSKGSFAADCKGCHGFPPQQNAAGGPLGYAKMTGADYSATAVFKDESKTPHFTHAGKAPYSFSCSECHMGNKHATGNFQQVFVVKTGIIAATGGSVPVYNPAGTGSCSSTYCHSNGAPAGGAIVYKTPAWGGAENSIAGTAAECGSCHDAAPATNAHPGHLSSGLGCVLCHGATASSNTAIQTDASKHVNGVKDVLFTGPAAVGGGATYNNTTRLCANLYCHSNGNPGALRYADPASWTSGVNYGCNGCHGTSTPVGAPDYANAGAGKPEANSHYAHTASATDTIICAACHYVTASSTTANSLVAGSQHLSGVVDVKFNPALAGSSASFDSATGTCSNITCHGGAPAIWGGNAACLTCHSVSIRGRAAIGAQFGGNSHHVQGTAINATHCYQCHWEANSDGSINHAYHHSNQPGGPVELVIYGAGVRPTSYVANSTAIQYTANGTRAEMAKINSHCLGCHSDQNNTTTPFGDGKTPKQYAWDGASIATKYGSQATTTWGKASGANTSTKAIVTKAMSAHGNASANQRGWDLTEKWPNTAGGALSILCFDCHNSHGSNLVGTTTSYASGTTNGGLLKDIVAGLGGYAASYQPKAGGAAANHNAYSAGAALCFDCHLTQNAGTTPWGYLGTYGATQSIMGYWDTPYFGQGTFGYQQRSPYKNTPNSGGHFGASSPLAVQAMGTIGGLCTPCHDPHGVSPTLGTDQPYGVPLLKGTWMTSPYQEDITPLATNERRGAVGEDGNQVAYTGASTPSYKIDQNTFDTGGTVSSYGTTLSTWSLSSTKRVTETSAQFAGLCLKCHPKSTIAPTPNPTVPSAWKSVDRIHNTVQGWGTYAKNANNAIHSFTCSKCHAPHNSGLPRLMTTNCLDFTHRGQVGTGGLKPVKVNIRGEEGAGQGNFPSGGGYTRLGGWGSEGSSTNRGPYFFGPNATCHDTTNSDSYPYNQLWNVKTPWNSAGSTTPPNASGVTDPVVNTVIPALCSSSCTVPLTWSASQSPSGRVQYQVQVSTDLSFATITKSSGWISTTSYSPTLLPTNTTYYWRVQARDASSTTKLSNWSGVGVFRLSTTSLTPNAPVPQTVTPAVCASNCLVPMAWGSVTTFSGTVEYQAQVSTSSTFATINYSSGWIPGTSWSAPLSTNTTYYWRVQARDAAQNQRVSAWSATGTFKLSDGVVATAPTVPALQTVTPAICASTCSTPMQWTASTCSGGTPQYLVQVATSSSFSTIKYNSGWISGTNWSYALPTNTTYYWRVQARNGSNTALVSAWSATGTFALSSTPPPPTVPVLQTVTPAKCASSCSTPMSWSASVNTSGATQYLVQISTSSSFSTVNYNSGWISATNWSYTLRTNTTYYWRVQARSASNTSVVSAWSTVGSFRLSSI